MTGRDGPLGGKGLVVSREVCGASPPLSTPCCLSSELARAPPAPSPPPGRLLISASVPRRLDAIGRGVDPVPSSSDNHRSRSSSCGDGPLPLCRICEGTLGVGRQDRAMVANCDEGVVGAVDIEGV
jgi:hypothetical protein